MSWISDATDFLLSEGIDLLSEAVTYNGTEIRATVGYTLFRAEDAYGVTLRTRSVDFLTADLTADPAPGDRIVHAGRTYEVLAPNGEPVWRWADRACRIRRIHAKELQ